VQDWFKPLAYALILLRQDGYPCVFYGDYYGTGGSNPIPGKREALDRLLEARQKSAYGEQADYFDHANTIGWVRLGDAAHEGSGLACVMSNGGDGYKRMCLGGLNGGTTWRDIMGAIADTVTLDEGGWSDFSCKGGSVSVYMRA
jgi:alpha-amylase